MGRLIPNAFNLMVVITVALGSMACSYGMAVISATIGQPMFYTDLDLTPQGEPGYSHTANLIGAMNGLNSAGSALGAAFTSWSADKFGRLRSIQMGAIVLIIGAGLCAGSVNVAMFLVARVIAGWGIGMLVTAIPMYQAEVSTPESRGFMVSLHGVLFAVGYMTSAWIGFGVYFISASGSTSSFPWRFPLAFQAVPAALLLCLSPWLPFSPRWLLQNDRPDEAYEIIKRLHHTKESTDDSQVKREFFQMKKQLELDRQIKAKTGRFEVFATAPNRKRAYVGFTLMFGNQFTGVLIVANYGVLLYSSLGMEDYMPLLLAALWVTASFPGNVFTAFFVDKIGRRFFLLTGLAGLVVTNSFEAALQAQFLGTDNTAGQKAAVFFIFLFIFFWSTFLDASQFVYLAEIFPTHIRSQGVALGMVGMYTSSIILLVAGPIALDEITWKFYLILIIPTALHFLNVYFFFPETKQRSLEDINQAFGEQVAVHYYGATAEEEEEYAKAMADLEVNGVSSGEDSKKKLVVEQVENA
ncbi:general substrate transporter [Eremomyces bilateralis CBS 781.70]|uniref:General substrate transporter n=1 Tax=Eremomyces bilateralis CBS 781.70 TaxID=1392243 RepID=A0A6G1G6K6_9PEZI|nr:general substrate transporter [Eremomyces bilateralis CBS 781.70]KAF1813591.1 general substrate transporter [Eremomyces bilateralis CBS 781.70]